MIEINNLTKIFLTVTALDNISLCIWQGGDCAIEDGPETDPEGV